MNTKVVRVPLEHDAPGILDLKPLMDLWYRNYTTRRQLRVLRGDELEDIGVDRATALRESRKPFWRI